MKTVLLLKGCPHCKKIYDNLYTNPKPNVSMIILDRNAANFVKNKYPNIRTFPTLYTKFGKNKKFISGSENILENLNGSNIEINYKNNNIGNIKNIRQYNNCFGNKCIEGLTRMDRPFGPNDNKYLLQGYQPSNALPLRSHIPINNFGMVTPGTKLWQEQRKPWPNNQIKLYDGPQNKLINLPSQYSNNKLNIKGQEKMINTCSNKLFGSTPKDRFPPPNNFGNSKPPVYVKALVNSNYPFLTANAGANSVSRITGKNFYPQQNPIKIQNPSVSYINGNLKRYVNDYKNQQKLLKAGFNSPWSINAQNIKNSFGASHEGGQKKQLVQTAFNSDQDQSGVAQKWKSNMFPKNGNGFGKKTVKNNNKTFTSPLGIKISF